MYEAIVTTYRSEFTRNGLLVEIGSMKSVARGWLAMEAADTARKGEGELWRHTYVEIAVTVKAKTVRELDAAMWAEARRQQAEYDQCDTTFCDYYIDTKRIK